MNPLHIEEQFEALARDIKNGSAFDKPHWKISTMIDEEHQQSKYPTIKFWTLVGWGILWLGFGGCVYLSSINGTPIEINTNAPSK